MNTERRLVTSARSNPGLTAASLQLERRNEARLQMAVTHLQPLTDAIPEVTAQLWHRLVLVLPDRTRGGTPDMTISDTLPD